MSRWVTPQQATNPNAVICTTHLTNHWDELRTVAISVKRNQQWLLLTESQAGPEQAGDTVDTVAREILSWCGEHQASEGPGQFYQVALLGSHAPAAGTGKAASKRSKANKELNMAELIKFSFRIGEVELDESPQRFALTSFKAALEGSQKQIESLHDTIEREQEYSRLCHRRMIEALEADSEGRRIGLEQLRMKYDYDRELRTEQREDAREQADARRQMEMLKSLRELMTQGLMIWRMMHGDKDAKASVEQMETESPGSTERSDIGQWFDAVPDDTKGKLEKAVGPDVWAMLVAATSAKDDGEITNILLRMKKWWDDMPKPAVHKMLEDMSTALGEQSAARLLEILIARGVLKIPGSS